ncbi:CAP domain-containing protein [Planctomicrobium sp. SH661]|uniref:CAP domain-containing protein n=1 Tax=Planctomicrobium sp. SH661 TaxID=3448124 RepID=UPI003F5BCF4E
MPKHFKAQLITGLAVCWLLAISSLQSFSQDETQKDLQQASEHGTIVITKAETGEYRPRFQPKIPEAVSTIIEQTNAFRKAEKLGPLERNDLLQKTAQDFADYMAKTGKYGHNADDHTPSERVAAHGYEICYVGENIAMQFKGNGFATGPLAKALFQGWKNSPPHRANMLQNSVTETGVAISQSPETGAYFAVQLVGRPMSQAIDFQVSNPTQADVLYRLNDEEFTIPARYTRRHILCSPTTVHLIQDGKPVTSLPAERGVRLTIKSTLEGLTFEKSSHPPDDFSFN